MCAAFANRTPRMPEALRDQPSHSRSWPSQYKAAIAENAAKWKLDRLPGLSADDVGEDQDASDPGQRDSTEFRCNEDIQSDIPQKRKSPSDSPASPEQAGILGSDSASIVEALRRQVQDQRQTIAKFRRITDDMGQALDRSSEDVIFLTGRLRLATGTLNEIPQEDNLGKLLAMLRSLEQSYSEAIENVDEFDIQDPGVAPTSSAIDLTSSITSSEPFINPDAAVNYFGKLSVVNAYRALQHSLQRDVCMVFVGYMTSVAAELFSKVNDPRRSVHCEIVASVSCFVTYCKKQMKIADSGYVHTMNGHAFAVARELMQHAKAAIVNCAGQTRSVLFLSVLGSANLMRDSPAYVYRCFLNEYGPLAQKLVVGQEPNFDSLPSNAQLEKLEKLEKENLEAKASGLPLYSPTSPQYSPKSTVLGKTEWDEAGNEAELEATQQDSSIEVGWDDGQYTATRAPRKKPDLPLLDPDEDPLPPPCRMQRQFSAASTVRTTSNSTTSSRLGDKLAQSK